MVMLLVSSVVLAVALRALVRKPAPVRVKEPRA